MPGTTTTDDTTTDDEVTMHGLTIDGVRVHGPGVRRLVLGVAVIGLLLAAACSSGDGEEEAGGGDVDDRSAVTSEDSPEANATLYAVTGLEYEDVTAPAGGIIEIANASGEDHTFTADDGSFDWSYGANENAFVDVPDEPGEYPFHCENHSAMTATLVAE